MALLSDIYGILVDLGPIFLHNLQNIRPSESENAKMLPCERFTWC